MDYSIYTFLLLFLDALKKMKGVNEVRNRQISQRSIDLSEQNFEKIFFEGPENFSNFGRFLEINSRGGL